MRHFLLALLALRYVATLPVSTEDYEQQELDQMENRRNPFRAGRTQSNVTDNGDSQQPNTMASNANETRWTKEHKAGSLPSTSSNDTELADRSPGAASRSYKHKSNQRMLRVKEENNQCAARRWYCNRPCYLLQLPGSRCQEPAPTDRCFDEAVQYNYTRDLDAPFPHHLKALSRFPSCWASLAPLICSWYYRPCGTWRTLEVGALGLYEFWQVYPYISCQRAREACKDVVKLGAWPQFLDCDAHTVPEKRLPNISTLPNLNRTLFGSGGECKFTYENIRVVSPSSCITPLADLPEGHRYTATLLPVLDACYMPCRTPNAKNSWILRTALLASIALLVLAVYLVSSKLNKKVAAPVTIESEPGKNKHVSARQALRRQEHTGASRSAVGGYLQRKSDLAMASLTCALVNATVYYVLWTIFVMYESNTTCLANSEIRRPSSIERIDSCQVQSFVMHFLTLATYAHVAVATLSLWKTDYDNNTCVSSIAAIYLCTAGVSWLFSQFIGVGVDGVTGICHFGLLHGLHSFPWLMSVTASGAVLFAIVAYLIVFATYHRSATYRRSRAVEEQNLRCFKMSILAQDGPDRHLLSEKKLPPVARIQLRTFVPLAIVVVSVVAVPLMATEFIFPGFSEPEERAHIRNSVRCSLARSLGNTGEELLAGNASDKECQPALDLDSYRAGVALKLILLPILTVLLSIVPWLLSLDQWMKSGDHANSASDYGYSEIDDVSVTSRENLLPSTLPPARQPQQSPCGVPQIRPKRVANSDSGVVRDIDYASSRHSSIAGRRRRRRSASSAPPRAEDIRRGVDPANFPQMIPFINPNDYYAGSYASKAASERIRLGEAYYGRPEGHEDQVHSDAQLMQRWMPYLQYQMAMNQQAQALWTWFQQASMAQGAQAPPFLPGMTAGHAPSMQEADTHVVDDRKRHRSYENRPRRVRRMASLDPTAQNAASGASMGGMTRHVPGTSSNSSNEYTPYPNIPIPANARPRAPGQMDRRRGSEPVAKGGPTHRRSHTAPGTPTRASGGHRPSDLTAQNEQDNPLQTKFDSPLYVMKDQKDGPYQRVMGMVEVQRGNDPPQLYPTLIELRPAENGRLLRLCPPPSTHVNAPPHLVNNAVPSAYFQNASTLPTPAAPQQNTYSQEQANARASPPDIVRSAFPQQMPQRRLPTQHELNDSERELYNPSSESSSSDTDELSTDSGEYPQ